MLTIVYVTGRQEPHIDWFFDSLCAQDLALDYDMVVVDRLADQRPEGWCWSFAKHVRPKPTVWQGPYRKTKEDWFAMANARNTGLCYARDGYIVYVDDLSVLDPMWTRSVKDAMEGGYCVAGAYRKVYDMEVKFGVLKSYRPGKFDPKRDPSFGDIIDVRWNHQQKDVDECPGGWLYGCSCGFPVSDLLDVNGWPEYCDGMGAEDTAMGKILVKAGKKIKYDKRMLTTESEEHHIISPRLRMTDKGKSPHDKSHAAKFRAEQMCWSPNPVNMRAEREIILGGGSFTPVTEPKTDWYDGQPIESMV